MHLLLISADAILCDANDGAIDDFLGRSFTENAIAESACNEAVATNINPKEKHLIADADILGSFAFVDNILRCIFVFSLELIG